MRTSAPEAFAVYGPRKSDLFTDWWPRERKAVFNSLIRVKQMEGHQMTRRKKRKVQLGCDGAKVINAIQKAASKAVAIYSAVEPVIKAIVTNRKKTK